MPETTPARTATTIEQAQSMLAEAEAIIQARRAGSVDQDNLPVVVRIQHDAPLLQVDDIRYSVERIVRMGRAADVFVEFESNSPARIPLQFQDLGDLPDLFPVGRDQRCTNQPTRQRGEADVWLIDTRRGPR